MLPTWLRSKRPAEEQEAEAQPKSKSRFQVDLKARKLDQFKTFLEPEEIVRPINPLADYIPIEKVANGHHLHQRSPLCQAGRGGPGQLSAP